MSGENYPGERCGLNIDIQRKNREISVNIIRLSMLSAAFLLEGTIFEATAESLKMFDPNTCHCNGKLCTCDQVPGVVFYSEVVDTASKHTPLVTDDDLKQFMGVQVKNQ
jgi:hypothetical protein